MRRLWCAVSMGLTLLASGQGRAEDLNLVTVAGSSVGAGGPATHAQLRFPDGIAFDRAGALYIADTHDFAVWRLDPATGTLASVAGTPGSPGFAGDGGPAAAAKLDIIGDVALDSAGNLYITDLFNQRIRKVDATTRIISTLAGTGTPGFSGDGGPAAAAQLRFPTAVAVDPHGNLFILDADNARIRRVAASTGIITTVAGNGTVGFSGDGGPATAASLDFGPVAAHLAFDAQGNLYFADSGNHRIRKVDATTGIITTVAGNGTPGYAGDGGLATAAQMTLPGGLAVDPAGSIYISSRRDRRIRKVDVTTGIITTVAGTGTFGISADGGLASATALALSDGLAVDANGYLYFSDSFSHRVRKIGPDGKVTTVAGRLQGDGGPAISAMLNQPIAVDFDAGGNLYIADRNYYRIRKADTNGVITTIAGTGFSTVSPTENPGDLGDGGAATAAIIHNAWDVAVDRRTGDIYIAEARINRIRKIDAATGTISTLAGNGKRAFAGDGGPASAASLNSPIGIALDRQGNLYVADTGNARVRRVDASTGTITTVAGSGTEGFAGDGGPATAAQLAGPTRVAFDAQDDFYIADTDNHRVRKVDAQTGIITTVAGNGTAGSGGDGGPATAASLISPFGLAVDLEGNVIIADNDGSYVRKVDARTGTITTLTGNGNPGFAGDGGPAAAAQISFPDGIARDPAGNIAITDGLNHRIRLLTSAARVTLDPDAFAQGNSGAVAISIEPQFALSRIDPATIRLYRVNPATSDPIGQALGALPGAYGAPVDRDANGRTELALPFDRARVRALGGPGETITLRVIGRTREGRYFSGDTSVRLP